eukprot:43733-Chlamydomonas_euryale.AAC.5
MPPPESKAGRVRTCRACLLLRVRTCPRAHTRPKHAAASEPQRRCAAAAGDVQAANALLLPPPPPPPRRQRTISAPFVRCAAPDAGRGGALPLPPVNAPKQTRCRVGLTQTRELAAQTARSYLPLPPTHPRARPALVDAPAALYRGRLEDPAALRRGCGCGAAAAAVAVRARQSSRRNRSSAGPAHALGESVEVDTGPGKARPQREATCRAAPCR